MSRRYLSDQSSLTKRRGFFGLAWVILLAVYGLWACLPVSTPQVLPTQTQLPPSQTPTPTIVWFPPTATFTPFPTAAVTPTVDLLMGLGDVIFQDDFSEASAWNLVEDPGGSVALGKNELSIVIQKNKTYLYSIRAEPVFSDFYLEITASPTFCRDKDEYGVLVRVSPTLDYYRYSLSCDGYVRLDRLVNGSASSPQTWVWSASVPPGAPSSSVVGVWAVGSEMRFFVNRQYQFTVRDPLLSSGSVGIFARSASDKPVTVSFSNLIIYEVTGK